VRAGILWRIPRQLEKKGNKCQTTGDESLNQVPGPGMPRRIGSCGLESNFSQILALKKRGAREGEEKQWGGWKGSSQKRKHAKPVRCVA